MILFRGGRGHKVKARGCVGSLCALTGEGELCEGVSADDVEDVVEHEVHGKQHNHKHSYGENLQQAQRLGNTGSGNSQRIRSPARARSPRGDVSQG